MSRKSLDSRVDSCTSQLLSWRPFNQQHSTPKTPDDSPKPYYSCYSPTGFNSTKRPCLSDRKTSLPIIDAAAAIDMSRLSLVDDDSTPKTVVSGRCNRGSFGLLARKRRRRGSRSVSGRSSDRSGTRRCGSVGAQGTCSDMPVTVGTDSSGELFCDTNWASDVSEARNSRRDRDRGGEKDNLAGGGIGSGQFGGFDAQGNESGYGSEPGYRGDAEFGYEDEFDEEEEDRVLFWGSHFGDSKMEMVGENTFSDQKTHHRCRRKKHDYRMVN